MAEKETINEPKDLVEATPEELEKLEEEVAKSEEKIAEIPKEKEETKINLESWIPKTKLGRLVKEGKAKDLDKILEEEKKILEPEIVDSLLRLESDLIMIGQAKGKFGGGKRRAWRQTQKKTMEGNVLSFSAMAIVGDKAGHIGAGYGKSGETLPAREKALRNAKLNIIKIKLGFESPENEKKGSEPHTVPFKIEGKCGSVRITLWPAPRGTGLVVNDECKKVLRLVGIKDVYSRAKGGINTTFNLIKACVNALEKTTKIKL
ncbi:30S ribosomal protein S5 [Candidatus Pacearchaeota archaeon]|nr:30S ribosomal protein S5 [Candidatus Pacearchaeota archaeon]